MVCGVCFGDVNRDGLLDVALGQHYSEPWTSPVPDRLYLNRGVKGDTGTPTFEDVTEAAGLVPLPMKGPHVEIQDFDNDGWDDLYVSIVKFDGAMMPHPLVFRNLGVRDGLPRFREDVLAVNDFPNAQDRAIKRSGQLFEKILKDRRIIYTAPGPSGDFDNDGRLDVFLASWWIESPSMLLRNETPGGHWLDLRVEGDAAKGVNRMGIGAKVKVYPAGQLENASALVGCREIAAGYGYTSGQAAVAHFGLGTLERVDVAITLPHGKGTVLRKDVKANQRLTVAP
jgi:hypothetical protein